VDAFTDTVTSLPENVLDLSVSRRAWNGVRVEVSEWQGAGWVSHRFPYETETRLVTLLKEVGSPCEPRLRDNRPCPVGYTPRHMDFAPAGMEMWGYSDDARFVKDATLAFDFAVLGERLETEIDSDAIATPRLRFSDDRIWPLVKLLSDAVNDPDPSTQLYGDGLAAAIMSRLLANPAQAGPAQSATDGSGLAPWKLRRVVDYLETRLPERVDLADLAALAGSLPPKGATKKKFRLSTGHRTCRGACHPRRPKRRTHHGLFHDRRRRTDFRQGLGSQGRSTHRFFTMAGRSAPTTGTPRCSSSCRRATASSRMTGAATDAPSWSPRVTTSTTTRPTPLPSPRPWT
jgi:AraC family transcriptional regulator